MASASTSNSLFAQLNSLSQLSLARQLGFMLILAASIALGSAIVLWSMNPGYTVLYTGLSDQDSSAVMAALEQNGLTYRIDGASGMITVPADQLRRIRMQLANQGLPRSTSQGFEILNQEQGLGTSNFVEQARYNRALEQELTQTIKQIRGVRDARVHLSIPRQGSFIRNTRKPSASVMIDIMDRQVPGDTQLSGIVHLVASSVAGLETSQVSIVDQRGTLLSDRDDSELGNTTEAIRFTRNIETNYSERILDLLTPIVGSGNVKAQVAASIDFTATETTEETYNPETLAVRSEQLEEETADLNGESETVVPGAVAANPPADTGDSENQTSNDSSRQTRTSTVRNYEVDRSVSHIKKTPGAIQQLSVAVLVDLSASAAGSMDQEGANASTANLQARVDRLTQLVKDAIGFNEARGDTVSVINEPFFSSELPEPEAVPIWQQAWFFNTAKQAGAALVVLMLIFAVLRPALKAVVSNGKTVPARNQANAAGSGAADEFGDEQVQLSGHAGSAQLAAPAGSPALTFDDNLVRAQNLVMQEPTRAARMIQNWLANE
ncbi:MAG: flagellar basal-body MS-ring/collar protein FliF [Gammaproteobacteria bacterium]|nr:flagellar M-ring protein FliF [Pseudomonadales bacterium]MCP5349054.1 flagellar M-ring protein FliF [Pseudomonadales bacterium]